MSTPVLDVSGLAYAYPDGHQALYGVDLHVHAGERVALLGPNGAGKTTLVRALAGLIPAEGRIAIGERPLASLAPRERARQVAYLPQGHAFHWPMAVAAVVALGRYPHADAFSSLTDEDRAAVARALVATSSEAFATRPVTTLSGGERARVALARALASEAPINFRLPHRSSDMARFRACPISKPILIQSRAEVKDMDPRWPLRASGRGSSAPSRRSRWRWRWRASTD